MAWYRFKFRHGPGHQGNTEVYRWCDEELSDELQRDEMHEIAHEKYIEDWFCDCDKVEVLPEQVLKDKISLYRGNLRYAQRMLKILGAAES